jgi:hypothetical protein
MRQLTLIFLLACTSCGIRASAPTAAPAEAGALLPQIRALIGSAACTDSSQCQTLAVGKRACGGPESYLPWSSAHTDGAQLRALAERLAQERKAELAKSGEMSTCRFIADPGAVCHAGTCQLRPGGPEAI